MRAAGGAGARAGAVPAPDDFFKLLVTGQAQQAHDLLARNRELVNSKVNAGHSLLHEAARNGSPDVVEWLLRRGANMSLRDRNGKTPKEVCQERYTSVKFEDWLAVYGSRVVAPDLDGLSDFSASCQVCFADGHLGLEKDDFIELPCKHRIHKPCMKEYIEGLLGEKASLMVNLTCQYVPSGKHHKCNFNLKTLSNIGYFIHLFRREPLTFDKVQKYLTDEAPFVAKCTACGDGVYMDSVEYQNLLCLCGNEFCGKCIDGPHPGKTCEEAAAAVGGKASAERNRMFHQLFREGHIKPCPMRCPHVGFIKTVGHDSCDHAKCPCGHEFCWECGADRRVIFAHDLRWHKPSCKYYSKRELVREAARRESTCPACQATPGDGPCSSPQDDGWPEAFLPPVPAESLGAFVPRQCRALLEKSPTILMDLRELVCRINWSDPELWLLVICLMMVLRMA